MSNTNVKRILFNPLLATRDDVRSFLKDQLPGTAHVYKKKLQVWDGKCFSEVDYTNRPASFFLDNTDLNAIGTSLYDRIKNHQGNLKDEESYTVVTPTEPFIDLPHIAGKNLLFALSLTGKPTFYDLGVGSVNESIICWASVTSQHLTGIWHSGDKSSGGVLLHHVQMEENLHRDPFVVFVSGYSNNALHRYAQQNPAVLLVNHETRSLYLVPIPLDPASIGTDTTVCCSAVGQRISDTHIRFTFLPNPPTCRGMHASGRMLRGARNAFQEAIQTARSICDHTIATAKQRSSAALLPIQPASASESTAVVRRTGDAGFIHISEVAIVEKGTSIPEFVRPSHVLWFKTGITLTEYDDRGGSSILADEVVFPCCLGNILEGRKLLALGQPSMGLPGNVRNDTFDSLFEKGKAPVIIVSDTMTDQCRLLNPTERINGLFIIKPKTPFDLKILDKEDLRHAFLIDLNINAITSLAGPQSLVVVQLAENFFFYRGIRWPGLLEFLPSFGDDITDEIVSLADADVNLPWPRRVSIGKEGNSLSPYFLGTKVSVSSIPDTFAAMSFDMIQERREDITDILTQLQTVMAGEDITHFAQKLIETMKDKISKAIEPYKGPYIDFMISNFSLGSRSPEDIKAMEVRKNTLHAAYRDAEKQATAACQWLIDGLGNLVSTRTSSAKKHDLKQLERKNKVATNVADAKTMTMDDLNHILGLHCREIGVVSGQIDGNVLQDMLREVAKNTLLGAVNHPPLNKKRLSAALTVRAGTEVATVLPLVRSFHKGPLASAKAGDDTICMAIPQSGPSHEGDGHHSALLWACFDEFVNLKDPSEMYWPQACMEGHIAKLRILTRSTIVGATAAKSLNIHPGNRDIGFFMIIALLHLMYDYATSRKGDIPTDFSGPYCQVMRGLFGQLLSIAASGSGKPLSMVWQLVLKNPKLELPPSDEIFMYTAMCDLLPHTGWPLDSFRKNVKLLLVRTLRERITDPVTEPMRKAVTAMKMAEANESLETRNAQLQFLQIAVEVVRHLQKSKSSTDDRVVKEKVRTVALRMLEKQPADIEKTRGFGIVIDYLRTIAKYGGTTETHHKHVAEACANMYAKRSARYKKAKNAVLTSGKKGNDSGVVEVIGKMEGEKERISETWGVDIANVKIQNWDPYVSIKAAGSASKDNLDKVSSDAERIRIPWRVLTGEEAPAAEIDEVVKSVLGDLSKQEVQKTTANAAASLNDPDANKAVMVIQSLDKRLAQIQKSDKAVELAAKLSKLEVADYATLANFSNPTAFAKFLSFATASPSETGREKLQSIIEMLLEGWRNPVIAEANALCCL
ncbi:uncharacterized protein EV422DRAFT_532163 [Fimicolochytrium jonesii]|uniref:uncharacterized protein n=1 Tax=Fimicolochytrium jonesii TaxID=1396493 RepID=UPI0022FE4227|nr:uncharacterized protein EV422DRAFT_532163 [Fimicolochytrium jonesii]KAI8820251.1 hypothetical protein EV422DRAFT_532163 [Fimicolochytrium jonesii]